MFTFAALRLSSTFLLLLVLCLLLAALLAASAAAPRGRRRTPYQQVLVVESARRHGLRPNQTRHALAAQVTGSLQSRTFGSLPPGGRPLADARCRARVSASACRAMNDTILYFIYLNIGGKGRKPLICR